MTLFAFARARVRRDALKAHVPMSVNITELDETQFTVTVSAEEPTKMAVTISMKAMPDLLT